LGAKNRAPLGPCDGGPDRERTTKRARHQARLSAPAHRPLGPPPRRASASQPVDAHLCRDASWKEAVRIIAFSLWTIWR